MFERLGSRLDVLTQVLDTIQAGKGLASRITLRSPWGIHFGEDAERHIGFQIVTCGRCWLTLDDDDLPIALGAADVVVFLRGSGHTLADFPTSVSAELSDFVSDIEPREWVDFPQGSGEQTTLLCGCYRFGIEDANPLSRGLPRLLHLRADDHPGSALQAAVRLLAAEAETRDPGLGMAVDRLVNLLFVYALRAWLTRHADDAGWFGALQDPVIGPSLRAIHESPSYNWTVSVLARQSGMSRAAFARRFHQQVGEPPLAYVTRWRMTIAADLLERGSRIAAVAAKVGYGNEFAFAKAFKRVRGLPPGQLRRRQAKEAASKPPTALTRTG
jgi:AraC-like DNA-binding protein